MRADAWSVLYGKPTNRSKNPRVCTAIAQCRAQRGQPCFQKGAGGWSGKVRMGSNAWSQDSTRFTVRISTQTNSALHRKISTKPSARPRTETMHTTFSIFYLDQNGATQ
jgi:hypothetical protein